MKPSKSTYSIFSFLLVALLVICIPIVASPSLPAPTSYKYVNDYVGILKTEEIQNLSLLGQELESKTGAQAVVALISSTDGIPTQDYANKLFRTWGIGEKNKDNGLLILIALQDQTWRVEVGRGLEGAIPDVLSHQIMEAYAKPYFISGDYSQGILQAYTVFTEQIATEYGITLDHSFVPLSFYQPSTPPTRHSNLWVWIIVLLFFADLLFNRGRIFSNFFALLFWSNIGRGGGPRGGGYGGGNGGFGGGSSNGGGSSGSW